MNHEYAAIEPRRDEIDAMTGPLLLEFGAPWCGYCRAAQPFIAEAMGQYRELRHIKIEDGKGRRLGRSFRIKLWPTLVLMKDGLEMARIVRPKDSQSISEAIAKLSA